MIGAAGLPTELSIFYSRFSFILSSLCIVFYYIKRFGYLKKKKLILFNNIFKLIIIRLDNAAAAISLGLDLQLCRPHTFQHCGQRSQICLAVAKV